jgi:hypothetical protein
MPILLLLLAVKLFLFLTISHQVVQSKLSILKTQLLLLLTLISLQTQTGLPESCKDLIILGATYRLLSNLDPARASMVSPQADETDNKRPYGSSQSITRQIYALFNQRLNEEIKKQQDTYPIRIHYSR